MRFYECKTISDGQTERFYLVVQMPEAEAIDVEIPSELKEEIDELQREFWRLEKREQRHTVHIEAIPDCFIPQQAAAESPEDLLIRQHNAHEVCSAFSQIPVKQQRRLVLRYVFDLPIKKIARIEQCSERSVKYSLRLAKDNLKDLLGDDFLEN